MWVKQVFKSGFGLPARAHFKIKTMTQQQKSNSQLWKEASLFNRFAIGFLFFGILITMLTIIWPSGGNDSKEQSIANVTQDSSLYDISFKDNIMMLKIVSRYRGERRYAIQDSSRCVGKPNIQIILKFDYNIPDRFKTVVHHTVGTINTIEDANELNRWHTITYIKLTTDIVEELKKCIALPEISSAKCPTSFLGTHRPNDFTLDKLKANFYKIHGE